MQEIWYKNPQTGEGGLLIPNMKLGWMLPPVGATWGPFVVTSVRPEGGMVDLEAIQNLLRGFARSWVVWCFRPHNNDQVLLVDSVSDDWRPPKLHDKWGPFRVISVDPKERVVVIEPRSDFLTEMPGESRRRSLAY